MSGSATGGAGESDSVDDEAQRVADGVAVALGAAAAGPATVLTGGASRQTWSVDVRWPDGRPDSAVLRRDRPGAGDAARMRREAACLAAAAKAGVPVPELLAHADDARGIDAPFLVTRRVRGESLPRRIQQSAALADARRGLAAELGRIAGRIHAIDSTSVPGLVHDDPVDGIEQLHRSVDRPRPVVELALRWLRANRPPPRPVGFVHGDFRLGNLLVDDDGVCAVLDWELAHLGDPTEDLGWLCVRAWRFGGPHPVAGIGHREQLLDGYESVTGHRPSPAEMRWWEVYGTLRWLVLSANQAHRHFGGDEPSLELAAIGRRICESEYDLLAELGLLGRPDTTPTPADPRVHDHPDPAEIVALVSGALTRDIIPALRDADPHVRYTARICARLLSIAGRELAEGQALAGSPTAPDAEVDEEADLARRIRSGVAPIDDAATVAAVVGFVRARVRVADPDRLGPHR